MKQKNNEAFDTFRDPAVSLDTNPTLKLQSNSALNQTMINQLRYSHLGSNTFTHTTNINCPIFKPQQIYKCQICSTLRQVCPKKRKNTHTHTYTQWRSVQKNNKKIGFNYTDRPRTPQFNEKTKKEIFINSMPNITKDIIRNKEVSPFEFSHTTANQKKQQDISFIQHDKQRQERKVINLKPPTSSSKKVYQHTHSNYTLPLNNKGFAPHANQTFTKIHIPQQKVIVQEIVYVPVIKNVLVPQIVLNPEISQSVNGTNGLLTPRNYLNSGTKSNYEHKYEQHAIMTPQNLRKLAQSIIR